MVNFQFYKFSKHKCPNSGAFFICGCNPRSGAAFLVDRELAQYQRTGKGLGNRSVPGESLSTRGIALYPVLELKLFSKFTYSFIPINQL
jgi:hypothetical protein